MKDIILAIIHSTENVIRSITESDYLPLLFLLIFLSIVAIGIWDYELAKLAAK